MDHTAYFMGVDPSNQIVWKLFDVDGNNFGVVNIYASNNGPNRSASWWCLALSLPKAKDKVSNLPNC